MNDATEQTPRALLRGRDAVAIIVGIVIGAGIYRTPPMVAGVTGDAGWMLAMWVAGGVVSLIGALCYAELASTYPHAGGDYHFLTRAFGRNVSFLYAWAKATVINTGSIALLSFVFGDYLSRIVSLGPFSTAIWAAFIVVAWHFLWAFDPARIGIVDGFDKSAGMLGSVSFASIDGPACHSISFADGGAEPFRVRNWYRCEIDLAYLSGHSVASA